MLMTLSKGLRKADECLQLELKSVQIKSGNIKLCISEAINQAGKISGKKMVPNILLRMIDFYTYQL